MTPLLQDVYDSIRSRPAKTALSFAAIGLGMGALTILLAVTSGLQKQSESLLSELGAQVFSITSASGKNRSTEPLTLHHARVLTANLPNGIVVPLRMYSIQTSQQDSRFTILAVGENFFRLQPWTVLQGRPLDSRDVESMERVAVVTEDFRQNSPCQIGDVILLEQSMFRIVGIVHRQAIPIRQDTPESRALPGTASVFIPLPIAHACFGKSGQSEAVLDSILIRSPDHVPLETTVRTCQHLFSQPGIPATPISYLTPDDLLRGIRRFQAAVTLSAGSVVLLCLLLGGITLASLMLATVRERVTEIGLRRALGATPKEISMLFVTESCLVCGIAALAGISLAIPLLAAWPETFPAPARITWQALTVPFVLSLVLGAVFAWLPARQASSITPAAALRND